MEDILGLFLDHDVDHVVDRDDAEQAVLPVDDRDRVDVVLGDQARDFFLRGVWPRGEQAPLHDVGDLPIGRCGEEAAQRHVAHQEPVRVEGIQALHGLDFGVDPLQLVEGLGHGPLRADRGDLLGHQAPGRSGRVAQEPLDLRRVARRHLREDRFALALCEVLEEEGDLVGRQPVEHRPQLPPARRCGGSAAGSRPSAPRAPPRPGRPEAPRRA